MIRKEIQVDRERIAGVIIFISLFVILLTMIGIRILDVKVSNIEVIDNGLYAVITDYGPVNVSKEDVLRIERTYTKAAITGASVEQDRIYTPKGFIYFSSLDPFCKTGLQFINSFDFGGKLVWIPPNNNQVTTASMETPTQLMNDNLRVIQPFSYAIGTPSNLSSVVFSVMSLQYLALAIGGLALMILIFPLRLATPLPVLPFIQEEPEFSSTEETLGAVAK
ncbi:MAG: hypothetical protein P4L59_17085 [Desulfosporosinus sp.]|nr:hypothetical protein [Desulfosporosinus sp.]